MLFRVITAFNCTHISNWNTKRQTKFCMLSENGQSRRTEQKCSQHQTEGGNPNSQPVDHNILKCMKAGLDWLTRLN